jgi:hypothetical protein
LVDFFFFELFVLASSSVSVEVGVFIDVAEVKAVVGVSFTEMFLVFLVIGVVLVVLVVLVGEEAVVVDSDENLFVLLGVLASVGALMFGLIIGTVSKVIRAIDARGHVIKHKSDLITDWMRSRNLPNDVRRKVRDHFEYVSHIKSAFPEREILEKLPSSLRRVVTRFSYIYIFEKIQFLKKLSDGFLHELLLMMQPVRLAGGKCLWRPGNRCRHLYILRQGLVQYEVPRKALDRWKELPITQQRKEQLAAEDKKNKKSKVIEEIEQQKRKITASS